MYMLAMNAIDSMPTSRRPADEPTFWLLNRRVGWRAADLQRVEIAPSGALILARRPGSGRSLGEASGSFGGLVAPANVALGDGAIYLLDLATARLKHFDPCACRFVVVPCIAGIGGGARQLLDARGIAVGNRNLYVCDAGSRCVKVFALSGFGLRAMWKPPASAELADWEPRGVAADRHGRVYVTDHTHGLVHRFSRAGGWEQFASGLGTLTHIAIDCDDRIYVLAESAPGMVRAFDCNGQPVEVPSQPEALAARFPRLPFTVDAF